MSDNGTSGPPAKPRIVIEFGGPGLADSSITWTEGMTTGQLYSAAWVLDAYAREMRAAEVLNAQRGLVVNPRDAFDILGRLGVHVPEPKPPERQE